MTQVGIRTTASGGGTSRRWRLRLLRLAVAGALLIGAVIGFGAPGKDAPLFATDVAAAAEGGPTVQTAWGPLTAADRELLVRVRLANLWERPTGLQAQEHAGSLRVKEVGRTLASDHLKLDEAVRTAARQLQIDLPNQPNVQQQGWMAELAGQFGEEYDATFTNRLRAAHGSVFGIVAEVRATTENGLVRQFAETGVAFVMKHMGLLESTGLYSADDRAVLGPPPIRGPITVPVIVTVAGLILVVNLLLAARRSWT
jgi:predicted outer membrane protein